jgi:hypothetical protein
VQVRFQKTRATHETGNPRDPLEAGRSDPPLPLIFRRPIYHLRESMTVLSNHRKMVAGHGEGFNPALEKHFPSEVFV